MVSKDGVDQAAVKQVADVVLQAIEDAHLAADHKLIAVRAYIRDEQKAEKLTATNERQKKFVEKQKEAGLKKAFIPEIVADAIKQAGGFDQWLESQKPAAVEIPGPELVVQVPTILTNEQNRLINLGERVDRLTGWRRDLINWLVR